MYRINACVLKKKDQNINEAGLFHRFRNVITKKNMCFIFILLVKGRDSFILGNVCIGRQYI